ncbi:MAG: serine O-acetyltransferase [Pseudomonadota bacterium]
MASHPLSSRKGTDLALLDPLWSTIRERAETITGDERAIASFVTDAILRHDRLEAALAHLLSQKLGNGLVGPLALRDLATEALNGDTRIGQAMRADLMAIVDRDPATEDPLEAFLFLKGFHGLQSHRIAHWLWTSGRGFEARYIQSRVSEVFGVDIHPAAPIGRGVLIDHASSVVIGETAVIEDDVSLLHGVTLGGTGKERGDRHPKIRQGVLIGAGAKILGNIEVGKCSRVASGSVVLKDVPPFKTVAGVPAVIVGESGCGQPSRAMDQTLAGPVRSGAEEKRSKTRPDEDTDGA